MPISIKRKAKPIPRKGRQVRVAATLEAYPVLCKDIQAFWKWIRGVKVKKRGSGHVGRSEWAYRCDMLDYQLQGACQVTRDGDLDEERKFLTLILSGMEDKET